MINASAPVTLWSGLWPGLLGMALLGSSVAVISAPDHLPAFALQGGRYALATVALVVGARVLRIHMVLPKGRDWLWVIGGALSGLVGFNAAVILGGRLVEPATFGAAVACIPIVLAIGGPLTRGRRPALRLVVGAAITTIGAVAVTGWGATSLIGVLFAGSLIVFEAGLTLLGAPSLPQMGAWSYSAATCATAAVIFVGLSAVFERPSPEVLVSPTALGAILYLGLIATALAFVLWFTSVKRVGAGRAGLAAGIAAPAAALIGSLLGRPLPSTVAWIGMAVIGIGLVVGVAGSRRATKPSPVPSQLEEVT